MADKNAGAVSLRSTHSQLPFSTVPIVQPPVARVQCSIRPPTAQSHSVLSCTGEPENEVRSCCVHLVQLAVEIRAVDARRRATCLSGGRSQGSLRRDCGRHSQRGRVTAMPRTQRRRRLHCSFCGKHQDQVQRLIAGPHGVYICDACITLCNEILAEEPPASQGESDRGSAPRVSVPWWHRLIGRWQISPRT